MPALLPEALAVTAITLHLVRHGETPGNAERRYQKPEVPLSDLGRSQAAAVAETLVVAAAGATVILASDYARTRETADIIAARLGLPIVEEPLLRERNYGVARGRLYTEFDEETRASWRSPRVRIEGGESWADVFVRVEALLARLRSSPPVSPLAREMVLVTHGGTMSVMLRHLAGGAVDAFVLEALENCAVRTVVL